MTAFEGDLWNDDWGSSKVHMFKDTSIGKESMFRALAKKYDVDVNEVENIHKIFRRYDEDDSGEIEYPEFCEMMQAFLHAPHMDDVPDKLMRRFWQAIDVDGSNCIEFEEFLLWYWQNFMDATNPGGSPMKNFYRKAAQRNPTGKKDDQEGDNPETELQRVAGGAAPTTAEGKKLRALQYQAAVLGDNFEFID